MAVEGWEVGILVLRNVRMHFYGVSLTKKHFGAHLLFLRQLALFTLSLNDPKTEENTAGIYCKPAFFFSTQYHACNETAGGKKDFRKRFAECKQVVHHSKRSGKKEGARRFTREKNSRRGSSSSPT